jgi:hypothetical protein
MATHADGDAEPPADDASGGRNRRRAALAVAPFLALGLLDVLLIYGFGIEPLWAFAVLPPILFVTVLAWIAFSTDFLEDRT